MRMAFSLSRTSMASLTVSIEHLSTQQMKLTERCSRFTAVLTSVSLLAADSLSLVCEVLASKADLSVAEPEHHQGPVLTVRLSRQQDSRLLVELVNLTKLATLTNGQPTNVKEGSDDNMPAPDAIFELFLGVRPFVSRQLRDRRTWPDEPGLPRT